jgi:IrrE N-terminal-like domain
VTLLQAALEQLPTGPPSAPSDLDALVAALDVRVCYTRERVGFDGATDLHAPQPVIELGWVDPSRSQSMLPWKAGVRLGDQLPHHYDARTRFTLAHELGHVLLHRLGESSQLPRRLGPAALEHACDALAAELLMPAHWFLDQVGQAPDMVGIRRTALLAGVSISSTMIRARTLRLGLVGVFLSHHPEQEWRLRRVYGVGMPLGTRLPGTAQEALGSAPLGAITPWRLAFLCGEHQHLLEGELRRTFMSAVLLAHAIDDRSPPAPGTWHCPR